MKIKLISIAAVVAIGVLVIILSVSKYVSIETEYNANLASARANAQKQIPYNAYNYYKTAFEIRCEDEAIYKEYIEQARQLGNNFYLPALQEYVTLFPNSAEAYELLCDAYYENGSYKTVLETALEARNKGIATESVKNRYNECAFMLKTIKSGVMEAQSFLGGYARVKVKDHYGYINMSGGFLLAPVYTEASTMMGAGACVNDGTEWHVINPKGYKIARTSTAVDYMGIPVGGKLPVAKGGKYAYVTTALEIPTELPYDYASNYKNGVAAVQKNGKWALIDVNEKPLTEYVFEDIVLDEFGTCCNGGVIFVKHNGKYYMVNTTGTKITETAFENAKPFVGNEPAAVCVNGLWGFVDNQGNMVIEPQYEDAVSFNIGLGGVCVDGKWGYINTSGTFRLECKYQDAKPFADTGIAAVKESDLWMYVRLLSYCS